MRALTIRHPFAAAIMAGIKRIEFRSWTTSHRGPLLIHAAKAPAHPDDCANFPTLDPAAFVYGAILGVVDLTDCQQAEDLEEGLVEYDWHLANPRPFRTPLPYRGVLRLFDVPGSLVRSYL